MVVWLASHQVAQHQRAEDREGNGIQIAPKVEKIFFFFFLFFFKLDFWMSGGGTGYCKSGKKRLCELRGT